MAGDHNRGTEPNDNMQQRGNGASGSASPVRTKSLRGFASMDAAKQREIASKGGKAAHQKGTAHEWSSDEARNAGRKGGEAVSRDRAHMAAIGREGGEASRGRARRKGSELSGSQSASGSDREIDRAVSREDDRSTLDRNASGGSIRPSDERDSDSAA